jgi:hypothetical protein
MKAARSLREMTRLLDTDLRLRRLCLIKPGQAAYSRSVLSRFIRRVGEENLYHGYDLATSDIKTSGPIINGQYSVMLVVGKSYDVETNNGHYYSLYVPTDVTTFTANF